jgi:hypothetical protein
MNVSTARPRIWITPATLPALKARAVPTNDRWQSVLQAANTAADWNTGVLNYALAYLVTSDASYAAKAFNLMTQSMAAGVGQVTPDSGYQSRNFFPAASIVYDWLYDWMMQPQRDQLRASIELCADWVFPRSNPSRKGQWGVDQPGNNYHAGFLTTWMAGLALSGDSPKAQGYIDEAVSRWTNLVTPYLANEARGGMWAEGVSYGTATTGFYLYSLLAHQSATGEDLISPNPWFTDMVTAMLHLTNPAMTELAPFGDIGAGPINDNHRRAMLLMASRDGRAQLWLDQVTPNRCTQRLNAGLEFLFYPGPPMPTGTPRTPPETFYSIPGVGVISSRSDWSKGAVQVLFAAGPTRESHQDRAQGAVLVSRDNQWLVGTAKLQSHSGIDQSAIDWTTLTVNGAEQVWTQDGVSILRQEDTPAYSYAMADLTAAYNGQLSVFIREILFLKPAIAGSSAYLLIADGYLPVDPASSVTWHLNTPLQPVVLGSGFQAGALFGQRLEPPTAPLATEVVRLAADQAIPTYRVNIPGDASGHFLVALESASAGRAVTSMSNAMGAGGVQGLRCQTRFVAWLAGGQASWSYFSPVTGGTHLLIGTPHTVYQTPVGPLTSSPCGILTFTGPPALVPVTITKGTTPPPPPPPPPPPVVKTFAISGTLTSQPDGSLVGLVTLEPQG